MSEQTQDTSAAISAIKLLAQQNAELLKKIDRQEKRHNYGGWAWRFVVSAIGIAKLLGLF